MSESDTPTGAPVPVPEGAPVDQSDNFEGSVGVMIAVPGKQGKALRINIAKYVIENDRYEHVGTYVLDHTQGTSIHLPPGCIAQLAEAPRSAANDPCKEVTIVAANDMPPRIIL